MMGDNDKVVFYTWDDDDFLFKRSFRAYPKSRILDTLLYCGCRLEKYNKSCIVVTLWRKILSFFQIFFFFCMLRGDTMNGRESAEL